MSDKWHRAYMECAYVFANLSHCNLRKVGCIIVKDKTIISHGYNGTPYGFDNNCEDCNNETLPFVIHAEMNAIVKLSNSNADCCGADLYTTTIPCIQCSSIIIQSKIKRVFYSEMKRTHGLDLLARANIETFQLTI